MPIYEYICKNCGHEFEELQSMKEEPFKICPVCGKDTLARLIGSGSGIIFKGSGFYHTDYKQGKGKSEKKESKTKAEEKTTPAEPSEKKAEKKESKKK